MLLAMASARLPARRVFASRCNYPRQRPLFCPRGQAPPAITGLCRACQATAWLHVHHRRRGAVSHPSGVRQGREAPPAPRERLAAFAWVRYA